MKTKQKIIDEDTRGEIKNFLKRALTRAMQSYDDYVHGRLDEAEKAKFAESHKTAKSAISHFETLLELANVADIPDENGDGMELAALLQQASAELDRYNANDKERDGDE